MNIEDLISKSLSSFDTYYALKNINSSKILVLKLQNKEVGFAELKRRGKIGVIFYIGILPEYRGKGLGKTLVTRAEEYFKDKGATLVIASTRSWNIPAVKMFKSLGYKVMKKEKVKASIIELLDAYEDDLVVCKEIGEGSCEEIKRR